jgi:hypothetical protein
MLHRHNYYSPLDGDETNGTPKAEEVSKGVAQRRLHDLRRTAVRNLDRAGVSRTVGMKLVGHRTEEIYNRNNIRSDDDRRDAARKLDAAGGQRPSSAQAAGR